jgi:hypothetical protein
VDDIVAQLEDQDGAEPGVIRAETETFLAALSEAGLFEPPA